MATYLKKSIYSEKHYKLCGLLKNARIEAGFTQIDIAYKLGKHQSFVAKYEGGERRLDVIELMEITKALNLSVKEVLSVIS